ncbi:MAG TPA: phosphoenolpyruvate synthase [Polyangiaceae bacterium]
MSYAYIQFFSDIDLSSLPEVGGKNASLGELFQALGAAEVRVPDGFALSVRAFRLHLEENGLSDWIYQALAAVNVRDVAELSRVAREIREKIRHAELPSGVRRELQQAYAELSARYGTSEADVAVRSSATAEDLPSASFAGQQESYLNVCGAPALDIAVRSCMASLFTDRAIVYRAERGFDHRSVALSVGVQKMVRSDLASAGVIFTLDTESGFRDVVLVTGSFGLGETVVKGRVNPDEFWVHKPTLRLGYRPIVRKELGSKAIKLIYARGGTSPVAEVAVPRGDRERFSLSDDEVLQLSAWAVAIEEHYSRRAGAPTPMDIEWAKDGRTDELYIVQARPETVQAQRSQLDFETYRLAAKGKLLAKGKSVGTRIGAGPVRVIRTAAELRNFRPGDVLVAPMTDPDWEPVLKTAAAVVTEQGGRTCHAAIISRELGIPCVVGARQALSVLPNGEEVTVSCAEGDDGKVYAGRLDFSREVIHLGDLPAPRVPVMLNVGNPERAFSLGRLPSAGVGLARIEFVISTWIGIHPMALLHPERVPADALAEIKTRTHAHARPADYFVDKLATGIAQIAAAFYPRPVIVRFSDFKTNEYKNLLGGAAFEPTESNPMIGFRGASRYYDERYREAFGLECSAILKVRNEMGLTNVKVMIPFCRTVQEGRDVLTEMAKHGLERGQNELEVYVMCEIPNNVVLADQFSQIFDGFSIGSNDLTQLTLGIDRDSALLARLFNERDDGVKRLIASVIRVAHEHGRKVGLCGQAPSDDPQFAEWLAGQGIDSISVTSDALPQVLRVLAAPVSADVRPAISSSSALVT